MLVIWAIDECSHSHMCAQVHAGIGVISKRMHREMLCSDKASVSSTVLF